MRPIFFFAIFGTSENVTFVGNLFIFQVGRCAGVEHPIRRGILDLGLILTARLFPRVVHGRCDPTTQDGPDCYRRTAETYKNNRRTTVEHGTERPFFVIDSVSCSLARDPKTPQKTATFFHFLFRGQVFGVKAGEATVREMVEFMTRVAKGTWLPARFPPSPLPWALYFCAHMSPRSGVFFPSYVYDSRFRNVDFCAKMMK